ncbi:MAG TPA: SpoIID/LytB domain-containing protein [Bacteroidales bacterium]|nr:SpoIID/LytB domain-containing protein [Bacteroidales bacterium]
MRIILTIFFLLNGVFSPGQVKIRLFTDLRPETIIFSVMSGKYVLDSFTGDPLHLVKGEPLIITRYNGRLAIKSRNKHGYVADSVLLRGVTSDASFSLRTDGTASVRKFYTGDLECVADLNTILLVNSCDEEKYVAGVVIAEGGSGKNIEYFKTQAVLARTYMYKYMNKHVNDGYNLCDDIHCQAYSGTCNDQLINKAVTETRGMVVLGQDSMLIISAFHSNCGGETASSEDVWLTQAPYLKKVKDPYCTAARNASWQKRYPAQDWISMIHRVSHSEIPVNITDTRFSPATRTADYKAGTVRIPFTSIRSDLNLRSAYFSVIPEGDDVILIGKGYGHGVGLCQEGAMVMASKGFSFRQIIEFYYTGVIISDISKAVPDTIIK